MILFRLAMVDEGKIRRAFESEPVVLGSRIRGVEGSSEMLNAIKRVKLPKGGTRI
jgi:hypothetical protein